MVKLREVMIGAKNLMITASDFGKICVKLFTPMTPPCTKAPDAKECTLLTSSALADCSRCDKSCTKGCLVTCCGKLPANAYND